MSLDAQVEEFVKDHPKYYIREFRKIQGAKGWVFSWNMAAFIFGPLWGAWRQLWGFFWFFLFVELLALVPIACGLWAEPGGDKRRRYERVLDNISQRQEEVEKMMSVGDAVGAETSSKIIENLQHVADQLKQQLAEENLMGLLVFGVILFTLIKIGEGLWANIVYEKSYWRWRTHPNTSGGGTNLVHLVFGTFLLAVIGPMTIFRFTHSEPDKVLKNILGISITRFPMGKELFSPLAKWGDQVFDWIAFHFGNVFSGITLSISFLIKALEILLIETPWPVVWILLVVTAFRLAGPRVAIFTTASLAYLALMGLWEISMITIALIGAGTTLCLIFGIPLGIWFGRNQRAYAMAQPILDFMQTMPAFVYLIPIIAFFGTGKPPGILATLIFAMPPVVRLTALGIRSVPAMTKEAAVAFGCSNWQLLRFVEIPLAMPSIMTGINQTIMMSLSMVVIASLIGAEGLGALILEALQYAAKGQGLLAGLAILLCAMVMDRIAQGAYNR